MLTLETCVFICLGHGSSIIFLKCYQLVLITDYKPHKALTKGFERFLIAIV